MRYSALERGPFLKMIPKKVKVKTPSRHPKGEWWLNETRQVARVDEYINKFSWFVYIGKSANFAINDFAKKTKVPGWEVEDNDRRYGHFAVYRPQKEGCIWFQKPFVYSPGVIAHECFHAVSYLMERLDVKQLEETEELFAYYLEFLVNKVYDVCLKIKR